MQDPTTHIQERSPDYLKFQLSPVRKDVEASAPDKLKPLHSFLYLLGMALLLYVTFQIIFKHYDRQAVARILQEANLFYILFALIAVFILQAVFGHILLVLTGHAAGRRYPFHIGLTTAMIGFFFNNITPSSSGGQPMELFYLHRRGIRVAHATLSFVALSLYYYLSKLILGAMAFFWNPARAWQSLQGYRPFFIVGSLLPFLMAWACFFLLFRPQFIGRVARRILNFLIARRLIKRRQQSRERLEDWLEQYEGGSRLLSAKLPLFLQLFAYYLLATAVYYMAFYFSAVAIGLRPAFWEFMRLQSLYILTASAIPTPGFVGLGESSFAKLFSPLLTADGAVATMIVARTVTLYFFLLIALGFTIYGFLSIRRNPFADRLLQQKLKPKKKSQA